MQRIDVTISAAGNEPLKLTFAATDSADQVAERLNTITWLVRQLDGHVAESRRRTRLAERAGASSAEPPTES
jgi:hypothetical protein